jgi:DNA-binding NtrC family response regulator
VPIDVRVIAATNSDLPERVVSGGFRRDLYARLAFWEIRVPALRARRPDLMPWIARLHERWGALRGETRPAALDFDATAVEAILLAPWLDNLRGLDRLVHRLAAEPRAAIAPADLELPAAQSPPPTTITATTVTNVAAANGRTASRPKRPIPTPEELRAALEQHGGSIRAVARYFGRDRKQIYRWIKDRAP